MKPVPAQSNLRYNINSWKYTKVHTIIQKKEKNFPAENLVFNNCVHLNNGLINQCRN